MIGERLSQARLLAGFSPEAFAAALTHQGYAVTEAALSQLEQNSGTPSARLLMLAAQILNVPVTYFTHQADTQVAWQAFRRNKLLTETQQRAIQTYARDVVDLHITLQRLLQPDDKPSLPPARPVRTVAQAEAAAANLRAFWDLDDHPINSITRIAESNRVIVVGWQTGSEHFDGLSGWSDGKHPITVVNMLASLDRRRHTLAHELGHLVMDLSEVSDNDVAERLATWFAAAFIVPAASARAELGERRAHLTLEELGILKRKYGMSMSAWIIRAKNLDIITPTHYRELNREMGKRGWVKPEPIEYVGEETPLQLDQMAHRAFSEGMISADRIRQAYPHWKESEALSSVTNHLTVYDLLAMPEAERERVMAQAFSKAAQDEFEQFDAYDEQDFNDAAF